MLALFEVAERCMSGDIAHISSFCNTKNLAGIKKVLWFFVGSKLCQIWNAVITGTGGGAINDQKSCRQVEIRMFIKLSGKD